MALFDKVKEQANQLAQKAQEAGKAGQAKIEDVQSRRKSDAMLRELGAALYSQRTGLVPENSSEIDRLIAAIKAFETEHGPIDADTPTSAPDVPNDPGAPEGGFKL